VAIEILKDYIEQAPFLRLVTTYRDPLKAMEYLQNNEVALIFLDINMPDLSGIQFLKTLHSLPLVIFTTAYSQFAVESYEYDAVDYLLKPIEFDRFLKAANKAVVQFHSRNKSEDLISHTVNVRFAEDKNFILVKSGTQLYRLKISDILYIRGAGNYIVFVTEEKKIMSLLTMKGVLEKLPSDHFYRIHRSFIVNVHQVDVIESEQVKIKNSVIPIGEVYRESFLNAIRK
jgi:DNA-binding LytR/AlgR family response regulator